MSIAPYHRDQMPDGLDHSLFGDECATLRLNAPTEWPERLAATHKVAFSLPGSSVFVPPGIDGNTQPFEPCDAQVDYVSTSPFRAVAFLPDHAIYRDEAEKGLISESLWHSEIFFSDWFRVDRSTNWKWRADRTWAVDRVFRNTVNYCYHRYSYQYFHWILDVLPHVWNLTTQSGLSKAAQWFTGRLSNSVQAGTLALYGVMPDDCLQLIDGENVCEFAELRYSAFSFVENINTLRPDFRSGTYNAGWAPNYLLDLSDRAVRAHGKTGRPGKRLYITRKTATHRRIINEDSVWRILEPLGFEAVDPGLLDFTDQVAAFSGAEIVVGSHGAGLTNLLWTDPQSALLEFMPDTLGDIGYRFLAQMTGRRHAALLCHSSAHPLGIAYADIEVDCDILASALRSLL